MDNESDSSPASNDGENEDLKETLQRLKEFSYYLTTSIENNLNLCLNLLEDGAGKKSNSDVVNTVSALATPIPYIGRGLGTALKEGEIFIHKRIDKKNSRKVADLVYYFNDNKKNMRKILIESSIDIFYSFEEQFMRLTSDGGPRRAMQKLAKDASNRIVTYFLEKKQGMDISKDDFTKGVISGDSLENKFKVKVGKSVKNLEEQEWKTASMYKKVGLFFEEKKEFLRNEETNCDKYGYRRAFEWESFDEIRAKWSFDIPEHLPKYHLMKENFSQFVSQISDYIMEKSIVEEATLDREKKHEELMDDNKTKHEEIVETILEQFGLVLDDLAKNYAEIKSSHKPNQDLGDLVATIKEQEVAEIGRHLNLDEKLTEIHTDVLVTKENQILLNQTTENIRNEVLETKNKIEEISISAGSNQEPVTLSDLVRDNYEVKKIQNALRTAETKTRKEWKRFTKRF